MVDDTDIPETEIAGTASATDKNSVTQKADTQNTIQQKTVGQAIVARKPVDETSWSDQVKKFTQQTMGGRQFWGDVHVFHDWTIQQNVHTRHYRLLDGDDVRHAHGTSDVCLAKLAEIRQQKKLAPMTGKVVILVHGIFRSAKAFKKMVAPLEKEGYTVIGFDYPSARIEIPDSADYLRKVIESLKGVTEINFVVHSMGGLVVRSYLTKGADKRIHRMVMLGVPNLGAHLAGKLQENVLFKALYGPAGKQMRNGLDGFAKKLPTPKFDFAIIAGGNGTDKGNNPLVPGDDDWVVSVANTRLPGAADFMRVDRIHSLLTSSDETVAATKRFLKTGCLHADGKPHPIPKKKAAKQPKAAQKNEKN